MPKQPVYLIDASIYIFKYYFALPPNWIAGNGYSTEAVYGFTAFLLNFMAVEQPEYAAVCFDESLDSCFRNEIYPSYKSSRALPDAALAYQLDACRRITEVLGFTCYSSERYEADDLLATLAYSLRHEDIGVSILSRDKDLGQLLHKSTDCLVDYGAGDCLFAEDIHEKFGVSPHQIPDYLALVGDPIDDIPGVPGIGKKTAQTLLAHFNSVEELLEDISVIERLTLRGKPRIMANLAEFSEQLTVSKVLATAAIDAPLSPPINSSSDLRMRVPNLPELEQLFDELGFPRLKTKLKKVLQPYVNYC